MFWVSVHEVLRSSSAYFKRCSRVTPIQLADRGLRATHTRRAVRSNGEAREALARKLIDYFWSALLSVALPVAWLPDSFGLTGALPQIIDYPRSELPLGMDYSFTKTRSLVGGLRA